MFGPAPSADCPPLQVHFLSGEPHKATGAYNENIFRGNNALINPIATSEYPQCAAPKNNIHTLPYGK